MASPPEEQRNQDDSPATKEMLHKTKLIQFLGRNTPIILQNDNGPCPLLAICNVLLLRNNLNLSSDVGEVSQEKLLSLLAERLIDSNSNVNNKDAGYVENQQQNIADAIDLLPRLTTGIDVNIKFTRIDDFEFTRECAIFDLLDIPLYHGWIVDPQDSDTASAIGLKSYNTLMGELVALETRNIESESKSLEEDCVDFVAATTASLGVPSPSISIAKSFDDSPHSEEKKERKGDLQEEEDLLRALKLSEAESPTTTNETKAINTIENNPSENSNSSDLKEHESVIPEEVNTKKNESCSQELSTNDDLTFETVPKQEACSSSQGETENATKEIQDQSGLVDDVNMVGNVKNVGETLDRSSCSSAAIGGIGSSMDMTQLIDESKSLTSSADGSEPIYEGEEHIQETSINYENKEPMYEGEAVLAEQGVKVSSSADEAKGKDGITPRQGEMIRNFLKNSASQLTIYGLFCLQEGLKERELCVFFRNNHFNTMFKFEGELYLLATDLGYINQPDLVWEKLNEVNGNSVFMTSNFKEFNAENQDSRSWDEQNALANTADYLASIDNSPQENTGFNSDLQLAIALQQQEFEQQQQLPSQPPPHNVPPPNTGGDSGLVTGSQHVQSSKTKGSSSSSSSKQESKSSKEKCIVM